MFRLVGFEEKKGSFTNKDTGEVVEYHNYDLHFLSDEKPEVVGHVVFTGKAKHEDLKINGAKELKDLIGKEVYPITDMVAKKDEEGKVRQMIVRLVAVG